MRKILPNFNSARRYCLLLAWLSLACGFETFFSLTQISQAETVTTNITGNGLGTQVLPQNNHVYGITGGKPVDTNLFHSFAQFNVAPGDTAQFQTPTLTPNAAMLNILGRITDANPSKIFGTIDSATYYPNANLFLMNPYGFLFGPNAMVNVGAMVAFTSADYLKLTDNARFNAIPNSTADALLTALPVASFGFLGSNPGAITVQGSQFSVTDGQSISLVGGSITIQAGTPDGGTAQPARLSALNGKIQLASAASPGEFDAATFQPLPATMDRASFTSFGSVTLAPGSSIDVSVTNTVSIRGGQFVLTVNDAVLTTATSPGTQDTIVLSRGSTIVTAAAGDDAGADVQIVGTSVQLDGASITSLSTGAGRGGAISVFAEDTVKLTGGAQLVSRTEGAGEGGNVSVEVTSSSGSVTISGFDLDGTLSGIVTPFLANPLTGEPIVVSGIYSLTSGSKPGGNISITAPTVSLLEGAVVATVTSGESSGGNVSINSDTFALSSGASLLSAAGLDFTAPDFVVSGSGAGGDIFVTATDSVTISGGNLDFVKPSYISSQTYNPAVSQALDQGHGGAITVSAPNIILEDAGSIVSETHGSGTGGDVIIFASNQLSVSGFSQDLGTASSILSVSSGTPSGNGGAIQVTAPSVTIEDGGRIATDKSSIGNGGDIALTVDDLTLRNGGSITASSSSDGSSGHIQITATGTLSISGQFIDPNNPGAGGWSAIKNVANENSSTRNGGIDIHVGKLMMRDGPLNATVDEAQIESTTGSPEGGTIRIIADDSISLSNNARILNRKGSFESGSISLEAPSISLDRSAIHGRTNIDRDAGAITLTATAGNLTLSNDSHVLTSTLQSSGTAGPIIAEASDSILLSGGSTIESSSSSVATGDGGSITLNAANQVTLSGTGTALLSTTAGSGNGGNIDASADQSVILTNGAAISTSSTGTSANAGNAGNITINAGKIFEARNSSVTTKSEHAGGGNVAINATDRFRLVNSHVNASAFINGGNISIDPNLVVLQNSQILAQAIQGNGGNITITTPLFLADSSSLVSASSQFGLNGTVTIQSPTSNLSGSLGTLTSKPSQAQSLLTQRCAALANGQASSFVVAGREQLPADPGGWLSGPIALAGIDAERFGDGAVAEGTSHLEPRTSGLLANDRVSLRRLTPAGFLIANFADSEATGCHS